MLTELEVKGGPLDGSTYSVHDEDTEMTLIHPYAGRYAIYIRHEYELKYFRTYKTRPEAHAFVDGWFKNQDTDSYIDSEYRQERNEDDDADTEQTC